MAKYAVAVQVYTTMIMQVEATSEEEARTKAKNEAYETDEMDVDGVGDILEISEISD